MRAALTDSAVFGEALLRSGALSPQHVGDERTTIRTPDTQSAQRSAEVVSRRLSVLTGPDAELVVRQELNAGGMGTIFLAEQASLGRAVAVKRSLSAGGELVIEARVAGQLEHPNIVPVYMLGIDLDGAPLLVMKRIEGRSWQEILKAEGVSLARDLDVLIDVCQALHFAHNRGVIHRDIKPANIMVGSFGEVYLVDWGVAAGFGARAPDGLPRAEDVRDVVGTPSYMAPEMAYPEGAMDAHGRLRRRRRVVRASHGKSTPQAQGLHCQLARRARLRATDVPVERERRACRDLQTSDAARPGGPIPKHRRIPRRAPNLSEPRRRARPV